MLLGCTFKPTACVGTEKGCASFTSSGVCNGQAGCGWIGDLTTGSCQGVAKACSQRASNECGTIGTSGCDLQIMRCAGSSLPCPGFVTSASCTAQHGCRWDDAPTTDGGGGTEGGGLAGSFDGGAAGTGGGGADKGGGVAGANGVAGTSGQAGAPGPGDPKLTLAMDSHDFGRMSVGDTSAEWYASVSNTGLGNTGPLKVTLAGPDAAQFAIPPGHDVCTGLDLAARPGACLIGLVVKPTVAGNLNATLTVAGTKGRSCADPRSSR